MNLWCPIVKRKDIIIWMRVYPNWKMNFTSKNSRKRCFSFKTKASVSFTLMWKMCLWCLIMKWNEIFMWICVYLHWKTNFNSKNSDKRCISYETKASIHLSQCREWICGARSLKEWRLLYESMFIPIEKWPLILKMAEKDFFPLKPKLQYHLS